MKGSDLDVRGKDIQSNGTIIIDKDIAKEIGYKHKTHTVKTMWYYEDQQGPGHSPQSGDGKLVLADNKAKSNHLHPIKEVSLTEEYEKFPEGSFSTPVVTIPKVRPDMIDVDDVDIVVDLFENLRQGDHAVLQIKWEEEEDIATTWVSVYERERHTQFFGPIKSE